MKTHVIAPAAISEDLRMVWRAHRDENESFHGPFFSPEYIEIAAAVQPAVKVAVLELPGMPPAFLPFQADRSGVAHPVGLRACDFSGLIAPRGLRWSPEQVIRSCGLAGWDFANVHAGDGSLQPYFRAFADSPYLDLRHGFEAFAEERQRAGSDLFRSVSQKTRKMAREAGPVRFDVQSLDRRALDRLVEWKSSQRARTGTIDVLRLEWMRQMIDRILATNTPTFAGLLSVVYSGDQVAAVHMGMRSQTVWHYWFAAFNPDLQRYSPGLTMLVEMAKAAPGMGIRTITLGLGDEQYKTRFASGSTTVAAGSVDCALGRRLSNAVWYAARSLSRQSPAVAAALRSVRRTGRRLFPA